MRNTEKSQPEPFGRYMQKSVTRTNPERTIVPGIVSISPKTSVHYRSVQEACPELNQLAKILSRQDRPAFLDLLLNSADPVYLVEYARHACQANPENKIRLFSDPGGLLDFDGVGTDIPALLAHCSASGFDQPREKLFSLLMLYANDFDQGWVKLFVDSGMNPEYSLPLNDGRGRAITCH